MEVSRKIVGRLGEDAACEYLKRKGFTIIARNYLRPWGEIDIIAEKEETVRFVEVKTLSRENMAGISREKNAYRPEEQVHPTKLKKIARTAEMYMSGTRDQRDFQIDVVGVYLDLVHKTAHCRLYEQVL